MNKKRILIPIVGQGSITHVIRTGMLDEISKFCTPVIALLWQQDDLVEELKSKGYEITFFPSYKMTVEYENLRYLINLWYRSKKVKTPSVALQKKYLNQFSKTQKSLQLRKALRERYYHLRFKLQPSYIKNVLKNEAHIVKQESTYKLFAEWLNTLNVYGLFTVTPFLPEVDLIARQMKEMGMPILASIHSFDNITKRGWQAITFDRYIVWNKYNKAELERIYPILQKELSIEIAGAPQFDFHYNSAYSWSREEWLKKLRLPSDKNIILYSGGPVSLLPDEPQYLKALKEAFEEGKISSNYVILFRCHPLDKVERWKNYVGLSPYIIYDYAPSGTSKLDHVNVLKEDIIKLISTLRHTSIHINVVSTMCVDGCVFNKPQIGPYYDDLKPDKVELFRGMYMQEHYRPILRTNTLNLAHTKEEFISLVNNTLESPEKYISNCESCVKEIITYTDGKSTNRVVQTIEKFFAS